MAAQHDKGKNWVDGKTVKQVAETDGTTSEQVSANLMGWDATVGAYVKLTVDHPTGSLNVLGGASGGGGAVTVADGADVAQGTTTDTTAANTVVGILKAIKAAVQGTLTVATHAVTQSGAPWTGQVVDGTTPSQKAAVSAAGAVKVDGSAVTQPVSGTFFQGTQPVSLAAAVDVSDRAARLLGVVDKGKVWDGTNIAAVKAASTLAVATDPALVVQHAPQRADASTLAVTATAAVNTALTLTLPAPAAGLFHYITSIQIVKLYSVVGVAAGAGVLITTTNLPGNPVWTTEQLASPAGTATTVVNLVPATPLKSSVAATATTIVAPIQLQTIWRINVTYYTAP